MLHFFLAIRSVGFGGLGLPAEPGERVWLEVVRGVARGVVVRAHQA